jgi:phytoene synthase
MAGVAHGGVAPMSRDTSFYYSFLVLPPEKRRAIVAVWDFCRAVDDAVDEAAPDSMRGDAMAPEVRQRAAESLASWRAELDAVYGGEPTTSQGRALKPFVERFSLPRRHFDALVDGVEMDLSYHRYPDFDTLLTYCHRVASSVGLVCLEIFGYRNPSARDYAINLGVALQLTNIIRDVAIDLRKGRVYMPADDLQWFGVTEADLAAGVVTPRIRQLLRYQCRRARDYYRRATEKLPVGDARGLLAAEIMAAIYFAILRRIEQRRYDVFSAVVRMPRWRRAAIAARLWMRSLLAWPRLGARRHAT